jgi:signal transduction histidine kinase
LNGLKKQNLSKQQKLVYIVMISGLILLITANIFAWLYLQRLKSFFISDLKFRLENIARSATELIDANDLELIIPGDESDSQVLYYQQLLYNIKNNNKLQDIFIISPGFDLLVNTDQVFDTAAPSLVIDNSVIEHALQGEYAVGELRSLGENLFLKAAVPLINSNNSISGVLVVEAPAEFFTTLDQYDKSLTIFSLINGLVIISVAFLFFRSLKKVVKLQDQMRNQEHLVKLGEMAAAVAHEIRNPLSIIKGTNTIINKKYASEKDELFTYIPDELDRLNQLIEDFLTFARNREPQYQDVRIDDLISRVRLGFLDYRKFTIQTEIESDIEQIETDPDMLEQVLLNAIQNSFQATSGEGEIRIKVQRQGRFARFQIADNGTGVDENILPRIFEPFYSTREKGSGLGLAISKQICEQLGGSISMSSGENQGTTLTILIPARRMR